MLDVVKIINQKYQDDLEKIWTEAEEESSAETIDLLKKIVKKTHRIEMTFITTRRNT